MKHCLVVFALAVAGTSSAFAQSGIIEGPFAPGSGAYTTVPGGTFELSDPLTGWADHNNFAQLSSVDNPIMRGDRVGWLTASSNGFYAVHTSLTNALTAGNTYVLSGFFRADETGGSVAIDIGNFGGQAWIQAAFTAVQIDTNTVGKWFFGYTTFVADNPTMTVRVVRNGPTELGAHSYFDDIAVTHANQFQPPAPVPEPATFAALSLGVLPLIRQRARKRAS